jgi:hypothetical protein
MGREPKKGLGVTGSEGLGLGEADAAVLGAAGYKHVSHQTRKVIQARPSTLTLNDGAFTLRRLAAAAETAGDMGVDPAIG